MADGEILYEARVDDSKIESDLDAVNKKVEKSTKDSGKKTENIEKATGEATKKINEDVTEHHKQQNDERVKDDEESGNQREKHAKSLAERIKGISGTTAKAIGAGMAAAGTAAVALGSKAVSSAVDMDQAMNQFIASTGKGKDETERYQKVLEDIYKNNYGDSFEDIAQSMAVVTQQLGDMSDEQLQKVTESAYALRDVFGYDISESTRAAKAMMDNFGISGDEAMSLIAAGAQNGLDYSGELIDSISEYSVQFAKVGLDADDMFKIFQKGADSGAFNLDKVGDAVKEMAIRVVDGSKTTKEGFAAIGLDADEMAAKFAAGGDSAKEAFQQTIDALAAMEDPIAQNTAGVNLFGTQWEDLGAEAVTALADIEDGVYDTGEAMEGLTEAKYDDLGSMFESLQRQVELLILPLGEQLIPILSELIGAIMPVMEAVLPVIVELLTSLLVPLGELISAILPPLLGVLTAIMPVFTAISEILGPIIELFTGLIAPIIELVAEAITPLIDIFSELISTILEPIMPLIETVASLFQGVLGDAIEAVKPVIKSLTDIFGGVLDFITGVFTGNWEKAWDGIVNIFRGIFNLIPSIVEGIINGAIGIINGLIGGINTITGAVGIPEIPKIPKVSLPRFKIGLDYVPEDDFPALLHEGEAVLTKEESERFREIGGIGGLESINRIERSLDNAPPQEPMDYDRIYDSVKSGAEAAQLRGYFDPRAAGKAIAPTVNREMASTSGQNGRYTV